MTSTRQPRVIALVGMPGSGKSLCAQHLQKRGFFQFRFGGIICDEVERRGWPVNPQNERIVREELRSIEGMDAVAKRALPTLKEALEQYPIIVIDGLYSWTEYKTLRRELGDIITVIAIVSPRHKRYERLANRPERPLTREEAEERDFNEIESLEKGGPIAIADYTLVNDGEIEALLARLDEIVDALVQQAQSEEQAAQ